MLMQSLAVLQFKGMDAVQALQAVLEQEGGRHGAGIMLLENRYRGEMSWEQWGLWLMTSGPPCGAQRWS